MITCALTKDQITIVYKKIYKELSTKGQEFNPDSFMKELFNQIAERSTPENAANFLQVVPSIIASQLITDFIGKINPSAYVADLYSKAAEYSNPDNLSKIISDLYAKPDLEGPREGAANQEQNEGNQEEDEDGRYDHSPRFTSPIVFGGTMIPFVTVDPATKNALFPEELDPEKKVLINTLDKLSKAFSMLEDPTVFSYQGKNLSLVGHNLANFTNADNIPYMDKTTVAEVTRSKTLVDRKLNQPGVTQAFNRVILVVSDQDGNPIYFDENGDITTQDKGKLVYQFMKDVRVKNNRYTATDIYDTENIIKSAEEIADKIYQPSDGDYAEFVKMIDKQQQESLKRLYDLKEEIINTKPMQIPLTGISTGVPSYLTSSYISLKDIIKFPGMSNAVYDSIDIIKSGSASGRAKITLNGTNFLLERPNITNELATEITEFIVNPEIPFSIRQSYINQFIPSTIHPSLKNYELLMNPKTEVVTLKIYPETGLKGIFTPYQLSSKDLKNATAQDIANIKTALYTALTEGNKGGPTKIVYADEPRKNGKYLRYDIGTKTISTQPYLDFLLNNVDATIDITNLDPGFYNYSLLFSQPDDILARLEKANETNYKNNTNKPIQDDSDVAKIRTALIERLENGEVITGRIAKPTTTTTGFDFFDANGNKARFYNQDLAITPENFAEVTEEALATGQALNLEARLELVPELQTTEGIKYNAIAVYANDKLVGYVRESSNEQFAKKQTPVQKATEAAIDVVEGIANPEIPTPENDNSTVSGVVNNPDVDISSIPGWEDLERSGYVNEILAKQVQANAKNWWENSPSGKELQKYLSLEQAANLVNSNVYAKFVLSAANLFNPTNVSSKGLLGEIQINPAKGSYVDVYHESWHAFSQLFLTKDQKFKLYDELRNYTDKNGNQPYAGKSYFELEETLAEDFRTYAKNQKPFKEAPIKTNLFRKILDFLKSIFGGLKSKFSKKEATQDIMRIPKVKELYENLFFGRLNDYTAAIENAHFFELDRGIVSTTKPSKDALSKSDSDLVSESIDSIFSQKLDDIYQARKLSGNTQSLKSASIVMLVDPAKRAWMYNEAKKEFQAKLDAEKKKLGDITNFPDFNSFKSLKEIKENAVGVMKSSKGEDKYIFLKSQIQDFSSLTADNKRGDRIKGESWHEIKVVSDFYVHNKIKSGRKPISIMVVSNLSDAQAQLDNYIAGGAKQYTSVELQQLPQPALTEEQEVILDNIRILQGAIDNWGDENSGVIKYHNENSDYEIGKKKYEIDTTSTDQDDNVFEESDSTSSDKPTDREGLQLDANKTGKLSLQQMMSKETTYILKSLFRVVDGKTVNNRLGFKERADFKKTFNIVAKAIGGISDRVEAYERLRIEASKFPEIKQLFDTKYPDPRVDEEGKPMITNTFEYDVSRQFWLDFGNKPKVQYWQVSVFPQLTQVFNQRTKQMETQTKGFEFKTVQASLDTSAISARWEGDFKSSIKTRYIKKTADNKSVLDLEQVVKDFDKNGELTDKKDQIFAFAKAIGLNFDDIEAIKDELSANTEYYGLNYIYKIVDGFNKLDRAKVAGEKLTTDQLEALETFKQNPVNTLRSDIKANVLTLFKGKKINQNTQIKRLIDLQAKYGYDNANLGVLRADGNRAYENMEYSTLFGRVEAINKAKSFEDLIKIPHMSYLAPGKNSFTKNGRSKLLESLFQNGNGAKISGKSLNPIFVSGTNIENVGGTNTTDLDPIGVALQSFLSMTTSGIVELPRTSEKKSSFGIRTEGGISSNIIDNMVQKGPDQYLYVDLNMFNNTDGERYAIKNYLVGYIATEFDRIKRFKSAERSELLRLTQYNREVENGLVSGELFSAFDTVLKPETKDELYALAEKQLSQDLETYLKGSDLMDKIYNDIVDYFDEKVQEEYSVYGKELGSVITEPLLTQAGLDQTVDREIAKKRLLKAYLYNDWIHKFEVSTLFIGDFSQWDHSKGDWSKRIPGLTSGGYGYLFDEGTIKFINGAFSQNTYATSKGIPTFQFGESIRTAVVQDAERTSVYVDELKEAWKEEYEQFLSKEEAAAAVAEDITAYEGMTESDGYAVMTLDAYRALHKVGRGWSIAQENLYQRIIKGEKIDPALAKQFFPIYKLHYFGAIGNAPIAATAMHKYAITPLIPNLAGTESNLDKLHMMMLKNNFQYLTFESGSKAATYISKGEVNGRADQIFTDKENKNIIDNMDSITPNEIFLAGLKEVTVINDELKKKIPIATQTRVINLDNQYSDGEIIDKDNESIVKSYESKVAEYSNLLKEDLLNEIGYEYVDGKYQGNLKKFISVIREELGANGVPDHLLRILNTTLDGQLVTDLSLHPEADGVEKILMSIIYKRLIKQTTNGEPLVQAPTTFTNGSWDAPYDSITDPAERRKLLGSNTLAFYRRGEIDPVTGKRLATSLAKCAIPFTDNYKNLLKLKDKDGNEIGTLDKLNVLIKDDAWLAENRLSISLFGPRIPNDASNTIEAMEIWHFLNPAAGNSIILPTEIVAKSGADFDADKLFLMQANLDQEGKFINEGVPMFETIYAQTKQLEKDAKLPDDALTSRQLLNKQKKFLQNEYLKASIDLLMLPNNFAYLTRPNKTYLVERYVKDLEKYSGGYNKFKNPHLVPANKSKDGKKDVLSPTRMLEVGYNRYVHDANLSLNKSLGIQAKRTKNHVLNKILGAKFPATYKKTAWDPISRSPQETDIDFDFKMRFPHNKVVIDGVEYISQGNERNINGDRITDINSHNLNGILDRAKNPFSFVLKMVPQAMNVINDMIEAGVPQETVYYFVNQPLIADYINNQRKFDSSYAFVFDANQSSAKTKAINAAMQTVINSVDEQDLMPITQAANLRHLKDVLNNLYKKDKEAVYEFTIGRKAPKAYKVSQIINSIKKGELGVEYISKITTVPEENKIQLVPYRYTPNLLGDDLYYYAAEILSKEYFPKGEIQIKDLKESLEDRGTDTLKQLAYLLNFIQLEKQGEGMNSVQMVSTGDTVKLGTVQQVNKREDALEALSGKSKIDKDYLDKFKNKSILSAFNQTQLIKDLIVPLMPLRLNSDISDYIAGALKYRARDIKNIYGAGVKGQEYFTTKFNNAIMDFIYQNYKSNFVNADGKLVNVPENYDGKKVTIDNNSPEDVVIKPNEIVVNTKLLEQDFNTKAYLVTNVSDRGYVTRGLDAFTPKQNPFKNVNEYYRYAIEREVLIATLPESVEQDKTFQKYLQKYKDGNAAFFAYVSDTALRNTFNAAYIMGTTKYSYTESLLEMLTEMRQSVKLVADYPIINQLSKARLRGNFSIIEFADKNNAKGSIASNYKRQISQLADPTIKKVDDPIENARISKMFQDFSSMMFFQHGIGKTTFGFPKILEVETFMKDMTEASLNFQRNYMNKDNLNLIFEKLLKDKRVPVKTYGIALDAYNEVTEMPQDEEQIRIDWESGDEVSSELEEKFNKKNIFTVTPQKGVSDAKAVIKASIATQFIGFGEDIVGSDGKRSTTQLYREQAGNLANTGNYSNNDVIFVSIPGRRGNAEIAKREQDKTIKEAIKAVEAGATILIDNKSYTEKSKYNTGEQRLLKNLEAKGYNYSEISIDGQLIGTYSKSVVQPTATPKGDEIKPGIYVNQGALTKEEQLELFNYLKPFIEEQGAKTNKGANASKMIGLGLRWDYKSNNPGRQAVNIPDVINPGNKNKYGYYTESINNQPLGEISPRFRELMQKASGVDMTNYDGAIINLYEKDTFISSHNDVDESRSAINYPVIGINIGGPGNFSIESRDGNPKKLDLQDGTGYVFGVDGVNREVWHRTFPTPQNSFLPALTTKIDGKSYPAGSYRITITMRRVMPIEPGMPQAPFISSTLPISSEENPTALQKDLEILQRELINLQQKQEEAYDLNINLIVAMALPKITAASARKETGTKIGIGKDINPSLLSNTGVSVQKAAEQVYEGEFFEEAGRPLTDIQEIRNIIIDILQVGKENYINEYNYQNDIIRVLNDIQDVEAKIRGEEGGVEKNSIQMEHVPRFKEAYIANGNQMPEVFDAVPGKSIWARNSKTNLYDLVSTDGTVLMENVSMIQGRVVETGKSKKPVPQRKKQEDLANLRAIANDLEMNFTIAAKGYDINEFISKLEAAETQTEYNEIMSKIRELLC